MPTPEDSGITVAELARQVRDVLVRFEGIVQRLESGQYVRSDIFDMYKLGVGVELNNIRAEVEELKDDRKWLIRLVGTFIILGILGAVFLVKGGG